MGISYDPDKRMATLKQRGLDFLDAPTIFSGRTFEVEDRRKNYGESRMVGYGRLEGRMVVVCYTQRGAVRHIISMRKANEREQTRIAARYQI